MKTMDYIRANRKGSREIEMENSYGWRSVNKPHKTKKQYTRKPKHKNRIEY